MLRGVQEQHDLVPHQFMCVPQDVRVYNSLVCYKYVEFVSENNQHRIKEELSTTEESLAASK